MTDQRRPDERVIPLTVRRGASWLLGPALCAVFPLAFALQEAAPTFWILLMIATTGGVGVGAWIYGRPSRVTAWLRKLPPPTIFAVVYPIALWGAVTIDYFRSADPDPTPQWV